MDLFKSDFLTLSYCDEFKLQKAIKCLQVEASKFKRDESRENKKFINFEERKRLFKSTK